MTDEAILKAEEELKVTKAAEVTQPAPTKATPETKQTAATEPAPGKENAGDTTNTVKVVSKTSAEDMEAKIKARAERFGGMQSDEAKKAARAAKFGTGAASNGSTKLGGAPSADLDTLKKRAERFGTSTSTSLKKIEVNEAIKRRQERFGVVDKNEPKVSLYDSLLSFDSFSFLFQPKKISFNNGANSVVMDEKMKSRAQRFGLA